MMRHGMCGTGAYKTWKAMKARCHNPKSESYYKYGARGIYVCDRWRYSFPAFLADMGERPEGLEIDRIDNDAGYYRDNCRWTTRKQNARNKRNTVREIPFVEGESPEDRLKKTVKLRLFKNREKVRKYHRNYYQTHKLKIQSNYYARKSKRLEQREKLK